MKETKLKKLTIRIIIPVCEDIEIENGFYCKQSKLTNFAGRKKILQKAMEYKARKIKLIVTSNNFFSFYPQKRIESKEQIGELATNALGELSPIKPLVIGFDLLTKRIAFNPYGGIDAVVCFLEVKDKTSYVCMSQIWECWEGRKKCNKSCFVKQNEERIFCLRGKRICLLSCGDILGYCNSNGDNLPDADIYLGLAHMDFKKWIVRRKVKDKDVSNIQIWKRNDKPAVIVTQQLSRNVVNKLDKNYFKNTNEYKYQLIWPTDVRDLQKFRMFGADNNEIEDIEKAKYFFVDIVV